MRFKQLKVHSKIDKKLPYSYPYSIRQYSLFFLISFFYEYIYVQFEMRFCNICIIHNRYSFLVFFTQFELLYSIYIFFAATYISSFNTLIFIVFTISKQVAIQTFHKKRHVMYVNYGCGMNHILFFMCIFLCQFFFSHMRVSFSYGCTCSYDNI